MKTTQKSIAEQEIEQEIHKMNQKIEQNRITTTDALYLVGKAHKVLIKCEELRKSRDNWRDKYEKLKQEKHG